MALCKSSGLAMALAGAVLFATSASAAVIGNLNVGSGGTVTVTIGSLTFNPDPSAFTTGASIDGEVGAGTNLSFAGCAGGLAPIGTVNGCLFTTEGIIFTPSTITPSTPPDNPFLSFAETADLTFSLTSYGAGSANTNCAALNIGDSCSIIAGAPLILTKTATGTQASFVVLGKAYDGSGVASNYVGQFNAPIANLSPLDLENIFCPGGVCNPATTFSTSTSGNFVASTIPEPTTLGFVLGSLLVGAGVIRRKRASL